jgi:hypothetical protein
LTLKLKEFTAVVSVTALAVVAGACGEDKSPSGPTTVVQANATLNAPAAQSPADNAQLDTFRPTLTVANGTSNVPGVSRVYEFQIADNPQFTASEASFISAFRVTVNATGITEGGNGQTSFTPSQDLQPFTRFYWRARFVQLGQGSPWSATQSFRTKIQGYNRGGELFDPLVDGQTVGERAGPTRFVPGKGLQLMSETGRVRYLMRPTVQTGEFSMVVENVRPNAGDGKNKIMSMQEGTGDITTNDYRMTVEHRGRPAGAVAWRFIASGSCCQVDTIGAERRIVNLVPNRSYLWKATWNGFFRVQIFDAASRAQLYNFGKGYNHAYRPETHYAYLGSPIGRAGPVDASKPEVIYRMVWLSSKPRPASLGSAFDETH